MITLIDETKFDDIIPENDERIVPHLGDVDNAVVGIDPPIGDLEGLDLDE